MKLILIDSSVWVDYLKSNNSNIQKKFEILIDNGLVCTNELILAELIPALLSRKEKEIIDILYSVQKIPLDIHWQEIITWQYHCIKKGFNHVGLPDLIIAQNAVQNNLSLFSLDKHFSQIVKIAGLKLYAA